MSVMTFQDSTVAAAPCCKTDGARTGRTRVLAMLVLLAGCGTSPPQQACAPGMGPPVRVFTLYFGQSIAGRSDVTPAEWKAFQDDTVTANLPNGYTVQDGRGAWMNPITRKTIQEATKILTVALPVGADGLAAVNRIRNEYQIRFHQQLVGMASMSGCGAF